MLIERMSKKLQELVLGDASNDVEENVDPVPSTTNLDEEGAAPDAMTLRAPQSIPPITEPGR